jgi:hypothetical protein
MKGMDGGRLLVGDVGDVGGWWGRWWGLWLHSC